MTYLRNLLKVEIIALLGLALCGLAIVACFLIAALVSDPSIKLDSDTAKFLSALFGFVILFGIAPAAFFGAPIYTALLLSGRASWISAAILGLLPGLAFLALEPGLAKFAFPAGAAVSLFTHFWFRKRLEPNSSFKPDPVHGSAQFRH